MSSWQTPQLRTWLTSDIGAVGSLLRTIVWMLPWQPWQDSGLPPLTLACTLPWNGVISSSWQSMQTSKDTGPSALRGCLTVAAVTWHSTHSRRLCAETLNSASLTASDLPASSFISGSSWQSRHF